MKKLALTLGCLLMASSVKAAPVDYQYNPGTPATEARAQWYELTKGEELARDKKVLFSPAPNYRLTTDENDPYDLTDGKLSAREDDRVWFNKDAVGWYLGVGTTGGVLMRIDLGSEQPVGQIAIRALGGYEQGSLGLPGKVEFLASNDDKQYYSLQEMAKLTESEKEQSDGKTGFYIPEEGKAFMAPFVARVPVKARYVALRVTPVNSLFVDQISVLRADDNTPLKVLSSFPKAQVFTEGLAFLPRHEPFTITTNIATPNYLTVFDNTSEDLAKNPAAFRMELPRGVQVSPVTKLDFKEVPSAHSGMQGYEFAYDGKNRSGNIGPIWIVKEENARIESDAKVLLTGIVNGKETNPLQYPINFVEIPETSPIEGLDVGLAWMNESVALDWPNFLQDWRKMGFNLVSSFPRYYGNKDKNGNWSETTQEKLNLLAEARKQGYGIIYNESPFHVMGNKIRSHEKSGKISEAEAQNIFLHINGERNKAMSTLYRGEYYQEELQRVADLAELIQPDHVYLDIEGWGQNINLSKRDPKVKAAWEKSGKEWEDFITDSGYEMVSQLVSGMRNKVDKEMVVGLYNSDPKNAVYHQYLAWDKHYPEIIDVAMPSLYIQGRALIVADRIRYDYEQMKTKEIIPWLSTGTYGEYNPKLTEPMVLEAILNGSRGITYYWFGDFDPMDFYYHSKALKALKPHEKLLQTGKPIAYKSDNSSLHYTAFASENEALILVGNYDGSPNTKTRLSLPLRSAKRATSSGESLPIRNGTVEINVPPGEFRLVAIN